MSDEVVHPPTWKPGARVVVLTGAGISQSRAFAPSGTEMGCGRSIESRRWPRLRRGEGIRTSFGDSINFDVHNCRRSPRIPPIMHSGPLRMRSPTD